jgi:hypothetical protein
MTNEQQDAGQPGTLIRVDVSVAVTVDLTREHYFTEHGSPREPDVQVQRLFGYMSPDGHLSLEGTGKQIKANGEPGSATRRVYGVRQAPDKLLTAIRESVQAAVAYDAEKFAAL